MIAQQPPKTPHSQTQLTLMGWKHSNPFPARPPSPVKGDEHLERQLPPAHHGAMAGRGNIRILSGTGNVELATLIANRLGITLAPCKVQKFANQETA